MAGLFDDFPDAPKGTGNTTTPKRGLFDDFPDAKPAESTLSKIVRVADDVVRQVADGATFGLADKIAAGMDALTGRGGSYDENLPKERARTKEFADENPVTAFGAQLAGGIATGGGIAKSGLTLLPRVKDAGLAAKVTAGAIEGAGYGAASGAGHTDGALSDYLTGAREGATAGAIVGGALPVAGTAIRKGYEIAEPLVRGPVRELPRGAGGILSTAATADRAGLDAVKALGPDAMLADAGPSFLGLAQGVATRPGEGRSALVNAVAERNQGRTGRLAQDTAENLGPARSPIAATEEILARRQAETGPLFREAFDAAPPVDVTTVVASVGQGLNKARGPEESALRKVVSMLRAPGPDGQPAWATDAETLHNVKVAIDSMVKYGDPTLGIAPGALSKAEGALRNVRGQLNHQLRNQVPGYAEANEASAALAKQAGAIERGTDVLAGGKTAVWPTDLAETMAKMTPEEQAALKLGARADVENRVGTQANDLAALKKAVGGEGDWNRDKMGQVFGAEPTDKLIKAVDREQTFANTYADVARGSQTGARKGGSDAIDEAAVSIPKNATVAGLAGHIGERIARAAFSGIVGIKSQADRAELGRILSATGPERDAVIDTLLKSADTRAAIGKALDQAVRHPALLRAVAIERGRPANR